ARVPSAPMAAFGTASAPADNSSTVLSALPASPPAAPSDFRQGCFRHHCLVCLHRWAAKEPSSHIDSSPGGFAASGIVIRFGIIGFALGETLAAGLVVLLLPALLDFTRLPPFCRLFSFRFFFVATFNSY